MPTPPSADVRQYLVEKYSDEDLEVLCADYFRDVSNDFAAGMSKGQKIQRLIEHCLRQDRWINLLEALRDSRPDQFRERFMQASPAAVEPASPRPVRNPRQVFISHAHQDAEFASLLSADLRQRGWMVWIAPDSIRPGEKWVTAIERGLAGSGVFLAVLTPDALDSSWVEDETHEAIELSHERKLRLLTLLVKPCDLSGRLIRRQQHVLFTGRYEDGLARLMEALSPQEPGPAVPTASPAAAPASPMSAPDRQVIEQPFHLELVRVPAGEFLMGSDPKKDTAAVDREQPQRRVSLPEYHIGRYPRVARGGSWSGFLHLARCACRFTYPTFGETPNGRDSSYGFRVARAGL
jgi:hypothetical protein